MNIYAEEGHKVIATNLLAGYESDILQAVNHLEKGKVYTVDHTIVHVSFTNVILKEFPKEIFNSVHFKDFKNTKIEIKRTRWRAMNKARRQLQRSEFNKAREMLKRMGFEQTGFSYEKSPGGEFKPFPDQRNAEESLCLIGADYGREPSRTVITRQPIGRRGQSMLDPEFNRLGAVTGRLSCSGEKGAGE